MTTKIRLTKTAVERIVPPEQGELIAWDEKLTGFGVRVSTSGRRTYFIHGRTVAGRQVKFKIGVHGAITAEMAREIAQIELGKIAAGNDPAADRRAAKEAERARLIAPTVKELAAEYLTAYATQHKRASSIADDRSMIDSIVAPRLGSRKVAEIGFTEIESLHRELRGTPYRANRVVALLSKMFNLAVKWGLRSDNPAKGVERYQEQRRQRYLRPDELARLAAALVEHPNRVSANAVRMLLLTGARRGEILSATWDQIDFEAGVWTKPSAKTKQKTEHRVPLSPSALELLKEIKAAASDAVQKVRRRGKLTKMSPFIFPNKEGDGHVTDVKHFWASICAVAEIEGARLHDLRHTYASLLASAGLSLPIIGQLLGHTQPSTTARYAHLMDDPLRQATTAVAAKLNEYAKAPRKGNLVAVKP